MASRNRGKIKIKLRDLARLKPTEEEEEAQRQQLIGANITTVVAILGASLIENMLDELLTSHFSRRDEVTWGLLTGDGGPLGSFSNKILAAYARSEEHTSELKSLMRISYAVFCLKKKITIQHKKY